MSLNGSFGIDADRAVRALESLQPAALLLARCHLAKVLFLSGLTKLRGPGRWSIDGWRLARQARTQRV
jgi:uncharacterized membrane protein YphA (DoxX/SURF4 family)